MLTKEIRLQKLLIWELLQLLYNFQFNEKYVAKRLVDAVCNLDYPKDQMNIMVLDDSDDDTVDVLEKTVNYYKTQGFQIEHVRRGTRKGYKAGALKYAMQITDTELVAIFDADFIPPTWFLKKLFLISQNQILD